MPTNLKDVERYMTWIPAEEKLKESGKLYFQIDRRIHRWQDMARYDSEGITKEFLLDEGYMEVHKYPEYYTSPDGEVYSFRSKRFIARVIIKHRVHVRLWNKGKERFVKTSRIVCRAYHGAPPPHHSQVNHKDLDTFNDHKSNVEWSTPAVNCQHRVANGGGVCRTKKPLQ